MGFRYLGFVLGAAKYTLKRFGETTCRGGRLRASHGPRGARASNETN